MIQNEKTYLGDGVYASFDGFQVKLTTEDGTYIQNKIFLEPNVIQNLLDYFKHIFDVEITVIKESKDD